MSTSKALISIAFVFVIFLVTGASVPVSAQTVDEAPKVCISQETADKCSQAFDEVVELRTAIANAKAEIAELKLKSKIDEAVKSEQREQIEELKRQRGTTVSFLFGLIKIRKNN